MTQVIEEVPMGYGGTVEENHPLIAQLDEGNLVSKLRDLEKKTEAGIYQDTMELYGEAVQSMSDWKRKYDKALKLAKMQPTNSKGDPIETKDFPFEGASLAMTPFILEAMLDFAARATPELVWTDELVSAKITGKDPEEVKEARGERVSTFMNYQLTDYIPGWRRGQDKVVMALPCVGTSYKKSYYDYEEKKVCSDLKMADKVIFNMEYDTFEDAPDKFEKLEYSRNDVIGFIRGEQGWNLAEDDLEEDKDTFEFIEAHTWVDLDEDGLKEPYCLILDELTQKIVSIYPDYDEDTIFFNGEGEVTKIRDCEPYTQYIFLPDPEGGPMGMGWGILLGPTFTAINKLVRDNLDAGTLNLTTANSGLIGMNIGQGKGNRQMGGPIKVKMGELTPVAIGGVGNLGQNVVQMPFSGPSTVLMALTEFLVESSRNLATAAYQVEANAGEAAELYLARLQQGLKVPNSIVMRVYESAKREFNKIALLNYKHYDNELYNRVLDEPEMYMMQRDFDPKDCDIEMVADPSQGSDVERIAKANNAYQRAFQEASAGINITNFRQAALDLAEAEGQPDVEALIPEPDPNPSPQMQMMMAKQQFEADLQEREMKVRERDMQLKEFKAQAEQLTEARDKALELSKLGLQADLDESTITKNYAEALAKLVEKCDLSYDDALAQVTRIEDIHIEANNGQVPTSNQIPA
jgi:chaperonin GroES